MGAQCSIICAWEELLAVDAEKKRVLKRGEERYADLVTANLQLHCITRNTQYLKKNVLHNCTSHKTMPAQQATHADTQASLRHVSRQA